MMREARNRVEGEQKGARKATRTRKAVPSCNPIFRMRQEAFGPNELEDCGGVYLPLYFYGTFCVRTDSTWRSWTPWPEHSLTGGIVTAELSREAR
eukprot:2017767-Pleurochrysis_carterae.AAC.1